MSIKPSKRYEAQGPTIKGANCDNCMQEHLQKKNPHFCCITSSGFSFFNQIRHTKLSIYKWVQLKQLMSNRSNLLALLRTDQTFQTGPKIICRESNFGHGVLLNNFHHVHVQRLSAHSQFTKTRTFVNI